MPMQKNTHWTPLQIGVGLCVFGAGEVIIRERGRHAGPLKDKEDFHKHCGAMQFYRTNLFVTS
jgi:hypothetical protein